jgi:hypothetical protein
LSAETKFRGHNAAALAAAAAAACNFCFLFCWYYLMLLVAAAAAYFIALLLCCFAALLQCCCFAAAAAELLMFAIYCLRIPAAVCLRCCLLLPVVFWQVSVAFLLSLLDAVADAVLLESQPSSH